MRTRNSMNPIVIVAVVLVLVIILGVVIWFFAANVIVGQIGKQASCKPHSCDPFQKNGLRGNLQDYRATTALSHIRECSLQGDRIGRGVFRFKLMIVIPNPVCSNIAAGNPCSIEN